MNRIKKISALLIVITMMGTILAVPAAADAIKIYVNGTQVFPDTDPVIVSDRTMVPIRVIAEAMGYGVGWNEETETVEIFNDEKTLEVKIGSPTIVKYYLDGFITVVEPITSDVAPFIMNDRTYLPVRAVSESLGAAVDWDEITESVFISQ